jgi:predicted O-methyltransferase YrrM
MHFVRRVTRAATAVATQPYEGLERAVERVAQWAERPRTSQPYRAHGDAEPRLHALLGAPWPCRSGQEFDELWPRLTSRLREAGLDIGRGSYDGWDDADSGLARVAWCLVRHLRPSAVVETGVARGLTTSVVLEGLERNGEGRLWSIDLPPLNRAELAGETGYAVDQHLRRRWTLLKGSSRRLLPGLVGGLDRVDMFVHDSLHTTRNVGFELSVVWPALAPGGVALLDDVERNRAFANFTRDHPDVAALLFEADDGRALFGCLCKPAPPTTTAPARSGSVDRARGFADG